jgi:hypothetical protein
MRNVLNFKKPAFWVIVLVVMATAGLVFAFTTDSKHEPPVPNLYRGYPIDALMDNKTPYVGNNGKVIGLIDAMPLPAGIIRDTVELQTNYLPYGITINYILNDYSNVLVNGAISGEAFYRNAIMLFSLIDNVDVINCKIADKTGQYDGALYVLPYSRKMAEEVVGEDVRSFAGSTNTLKNLIDRINNTPLGPNLGTDTFYDFSLLYSYKNISISDSNKVRELVSQLQYAKELPIERIELKSENEEILRIDYRMNLTSGQEYKVNHSKMMADAVILFALLDNLDAVEYNLIQEDYGYGGVPLTREQAEQVLGADIGSLGKTEEAFLSGMPIIANLQWNPDIMNIITYEHIMR